MERTFRSRTQPEIPVQARRHRRRVTGPLQGLGPERPADQLITCRTGPMAPALTHSQSRRVSSESWFITATWVATPAWRTTSAIRRASKTIRAIGFWQKTCLSFRLAATLTAA